MAQVLGSKDQHGSGTGVLQVNMAQVLGSYRSTWQVLGSYRSTWLRYWGLKVNMAQLLGSYRSTWLRYWGLTGQHGSGTWV